MTAMIENKKILIKNLRNDIGVTRKTFCRLLPVSERLLADLETAKRPLSDTVRREVNELNRLTSALKKVIEPTYLAEWLSTPNQAFEGLKPIEVIERGEVDRIWRMIYALESGLPT